ncbi:inositol monophosphatase family protein [Flavobacterium sp. N1994]|uniref:inositol monophosphatase family protein n=1 Tax=Flavobacterium sp. N1994 TaxID=2986827 RepID=UPI002221A839|nr:inositol monophosphatase family protein [Flavobacterium sp. N1994]
MSTLTPLISEIKAQLETVLQLRNTKKKKEDDSYVSEGDLLLDKVCMDYINRTYSSVQIITEETYSNGEVDLNAFEYTAVVDPIDGTENFVSGLMEWGVGVCIYKGSQFEEALIALPELNQYLLSDSLVFEKYDSRIYGISSSLTKEDLLNLESGFEYRIIGCCMYNMFNVITGRYKMFQNPKGARCWDILPGLNMAHKLGLDVTVNNNKYNGEFLQPAEKYRFKISN